MYGIMDAATTYLVQIKAGKTDVLTFYAANQYLESCYPYVPKFGILKGYVNTANRLSQACWNSFEKKK
jgi:hypothetical protein